MTVSERAPAFSAGISLARRLSFSKASRFICNFICEYFLKTCASPWRTALLQDLRKQANLTEIWFGVRFLLLKDGRTVMSEESDVFSSPEQVGAALRRTGYIADPIATTTVFLAAKLQKPVLLEGPAGMRHLPRRIHGLQRHRFCVR